MDYSRRPTLVESILILLLILVIGMIAIPKLSMIFFTSDHHEVVEEKLHVFKKSLNQLIGDYLIDLRPQCRPDPHHPHTVFWFYWQTSSSFTPSIQSVQKTQGDCTQLNPAPPQKPLLLTSASCQGIFAALADIDILSIGQTQQDRTTFPWLAYAGNLTDEREGKEQQIPSGCYFVHSSSLAYFTYNPALGIVSNVLTTGQQLHIP